MKPADRAAFLTELAGVYSFYRQELTSFHARVWENACAQHDLDQVQRAFQIHMEDPDCGQFLPKPADIVKHLQGTHGDRALTAWGKALEAMQRVGSYSSIAFDDGVIHAVIEDLGGWPQLCRTTYDELPFVQKRFCDSYRAYSRRGDVQFPGRLLGSSEIENTKSGHDVTPRTVLIGDPKKAAQVQQLGVATTRTRLTAIDGLIPRARLAHTTS